MIFERQHLAGRLLPALCALGLLAGCESASPTAQAPAAEPGVFTPTRNGPEGAAAGTCWGRTVSPAVVESVSQRVQVKPAKVNPDGTVAELPVYRTENRQVIVTPRRDNWFETPCPDVLTPEFISSLQRALQARGTFGGIVTGVMDAPTRAAVQRFQKPRGLDSGVLSLDSARALGLVAVDRATSG
ncbi:peptidoglycan-binding domain-containing protein [Marimonas sp. MJW-29]|uniref:Peptidoglycan-binding domain-containing protein n=1 Tax=Sulfitobacter sediminis TaxID=3234186 RepID=A0ABV3RK97_9RHOB